MHLELVKNADPRAPPWTYRFSKSLSLRIHWGCKAQNITTSVGDNAMHGDSPEGTSPLLFPAFYPHLST